MQKLLTFFQQKNTAIFQILTFEILTNDVVIFEPPSPKDKDFKDNFGMFCKFLNNFSLIRTAFVPFPMGVSYLFGCKTGFYSHKNEYK